MTTETKTRTDDADRETEPSADDIRAQLATILASPHFRRAGRMKRFLEYIVDETLAGRADLLKEYTIAIEVFDRDESFDPTTSALVRVEAGRMAGKNVVSFHWELPVRKVLLNGEAVFTQTKFCLRGDFCGRCAHLQLPA